MAKKTKPTLVRPLDSDTMGRMGQSRFGELCDGGNLIANDSQRADRMGWDYLVEFPLPSQRNNKPFDSRSKLPDLKIQVKTIWFDRNRIDIDLPAVERLMRWNYPSFIIIMRMNIDQTYLDAYVIHLLDENLARVLKSLRQAEAKQSLTIKDKTLSFKITDGVKIDVTGIDLANALRSAVGDQPDAYLIQKRDQLQNLGFESQRFQGKFSLTTTSEDETLDIFLGLRKAEVTDFKVDEVRFGIPIAHQSETNAILEIKPESHGPCEVVMTSSNSDRKRAIFSAHLYGVTSTMTAKGPWKIRVHSPIIEILCSHAESEAKCIFGPPSGVRLSLDDHIVIARARLIMASGPSTSLVRFNGKRLFEFHVGRETNFSIQEASSRLSLLTDFKALLDETGISGVLLDEDDIATHIGSIQFCLLSQKPDNTIQISMRIKPLVDEHKIPNELDGLFASKITLSEKTLAFWALMRVTTEPQNEEVVAVRSHHFSLRDIVDLGPNLTFDDFVSEASAIYDLSFVIKTESINWFGHTSPEIAHDDSEGA